MGEEAKRGASGPEQILAWCFPEGDLCSAERRRFGRSMGRFGGGAVPGRGGSGAGPFGVRVLIGDVQGHGLAAVGTVAALLGAFREGVLDDAELAASMEAW